MHERVKKKSYLASWFGKVFSKEVPLGHVSFRNKTPTGYYFNTRRCSTITETDKQMTHHFAEEGWRETIPCLPVHIIAYHKVGMKKPYVVSRETINIVRGDTCSNSVNDNCANPLCTNHKGWGTDHAGRKFVLSPQSPLQDKVV